MKATAEEAIWNGSMGGTNFGGSINVVNYYPELPYQRIETHAVDLPITATHGTIPRARIEASSDALTTRGSEQCAATLKG